MTAIAIAVVTLAVLGAFLYVVRRGDSAIEKRSEIRDVQQDAERGLEREKYEHELTKRDLTAATRRADVLEALLAAEQENHEDDDLDPRDVRGRVLREALRWRPAAGDPVHPEPADDVPPKGGSTTGSGTSELRSATGPDV